MHVVSLKYFTYHLLLVPVLVLNYKLYILSLLKLKKYVILYINFILNLFICFFGGWWGA
jgi:hypothetical protein